MPVKTKVSVGVGLGVGLASLAGIGYLWKFWNLEKPPTKWRKVGELSDLMCFPIKSAGVIRLDEMDCSVLGIQNEHLRDRVFMCVTMERHFISARAHPKLLLIQPRHEGNKMILSAPGMSDIELDVEDLASLPRAKHSVWGQPVESIDCGDEIAAWLSQFLMDNESIIRLVYYPHNTSKRELSNQNKSFDAFVQEDCGAFHDESSYMLMTESSVEDLNSRLLHDPVGVQQFRPNFVVRGSEPFEEDNWQWVRIGEATFRNIRPCARCMLTTIDPVTGIRSKDMEPLKTLRTYRIQSKISKKDPILGIHLGLRSGGNIKVGDNVYVEAN